MSVPNVDSTTTTILTAEQIAAPALEALGRGAARRVMARVVNFVNAGRIDAAQTLVADEVTLAALQAEISRHIDACPTCAVAPLYGYVRCLDLERLERRETRLLVLVATAGGLR